MQNSVGWLTPPPTHSLHPVAWTQRPETYPSFLVSPAPSSSPSQPDVARPAGSILGYFYLLPRVGYESIRHCVRVRIKALLDWRRTHGYHSSDWCERTVISMGFIAARLISSLPVKKFIFRQNKRRVGPTCCVVGLDQEVERRGWLQGCLMNVGCVLLSILYQSFGRENILIHSKKTVRFILVCCESLAAPFQSGLFPDFWITCCTRSSRNLMVIAKLWRLLQKA